MDKILCFANTFLFFIFFISNPSISITCRTERTGQRRTPAEQTELGHAEHICAVKVTVHLRQSISLSNTCRTHSTGPHKTRSCCTYPSLSNSCRTQRKGPRMKVSCCTSVHHSPTPVDQREHGHVEHIRFIEVTVHVHQSHHLPMPVDQREHAT